MAARVIRYLSCHEETLYHGGKRASVSIVAARLLLVIESLVVCGHVLSGSVVIFCVCAHYLDRGLWSCPGRLFGHVLGVVISWVCVHFLDRGLWSCPGWVCGHLLGLWSFPDSWFVVMSWLGLWSSPKSVIISWLVMSWVCGHVLGLWSCPGSVVIFAVVMSWVCGHLLVP